jgi:hypothetical protein
MEVFMSRPASADEQILMNARKAIASAQTLETPRNTHPQKPGVKQDHQADGPRRGPL